MPIAEIALALLYDSEKKARADLTTAISGKIIHSPVFRCVVGWRERKLDVHILSYTYYFVKTDWVS